MEWKNPYQLLHYLFLKWTVRFSSSPNQICSGTANGEKQHILKSNQFWNLNTCWCFSSLSQNSIFYPKSSKHSSNNLLHLTTSSLRLLNIIFLIAEDGKMEKSEKLSYFPKTTQWVRIRVKSTSDNFSSAILNAGYSLSATFPTGRGNNFLKNCCNSTCKLLGQMC